MTREWTIFAGAIVLAMLILLLGQGRSVSVKDGVVARDFYQGIDRLAAHRAVYDVKTISVRQGAKIQNASGELTYEWYPDCEGAVTQFSFDMRYDYSAEPAMHIISKTRNYESFVDGRLHYNVQRFLPHDEQPFYQKRGEADAATLSVQEDMGSDVSQVSTLPDGTLFSTRYILRLLDTIAKRKPFFGTNYFDGSDEQGALFVNTYIDYTGAYVPDAALPDDVDVHLLSGRGYPLQMAFFTQKGDAAVPDYEMHAFFYENGVMRNMDIEYDDFSISQSLVSLQPIEHTCQ